MKRLHENRLKHERCYTGRNHEATFKTDARKAKYYFIIGCCFSLLFECNIVHYVKDSPTLLILLFFLLCFIFVDALSFSLCKISKEEERFRLMVYNTFRNK